MPTLQITLILVWLTTFAAGQLFFKRSLGESSEPLSRRRRVSIFAVGILCMTVSFFLQLGLLQELDLSRLFPFQGLSVIIVTLGASIFLKERLTLPVVAGALLITAGVMLVSAS